jgi:hypothetical protein
MNRIKRWWKQVTLEEYELIITVPDTTVIHEDGSRTENTKQISFRASKLIKTTPKIFIFIDIDGQRHDIRFLQPKDFHIVKIW